MLTLIVTAHRTNYLLEALTSIAAQNNKNFHLILCADVHLYPQTYDFFEKYRKNIECLSSKTITIVGNGTAGCVRNFAFEQVNTDWLCYLDGDDMLLPDAIDVVLNTIESNNCDIMSSGIIRIEQDGTYKYWDKSLSYYPKKSIYFEDPDLVGEMTFFNHFQVMKKVQWEKYKYNEETNGEDIDFMLHQLLLGKYHKIPSYLYAYRNTPNSFASDERFEKCDICTQRYLNGYYSEYYERKYDDEYKMNFFENYEN